MQRRTLLVALTLLTGLAMPQPLFADDAPDKTVRYRHKAMDALGSHMGASSMILKGQVSREKDLASHARAMDDIAKTLPDLFPKGTQKDSEAKKEIWENWDDFLAACKTFEEATGALVEATKKHDLAAAKTAYEKVGSSCGGCHDKFRVEDDH